MKIIAKVGKLPIKTTVVDYLVEVLAPIHLVPQMVSITLAGNLISGNTALKAQIRELIPKNIDVELADIELIECDLLVPKTVQPGMTEALDESKRVS